MFLIALLSALQPLLLSTSFTYVLASTAYLHMPQLFSLHPLIAHHHLCYIDVYHVCSIKQLLYIFVYSSPFMYYFCKNFLLPCFSCILCFCVYFVPDCLPLFGLMAFCIWVFHDLFGCFNIAGCVWFVCVAVLFLCFVNVHLYCIIVKPFSVLLISLMCVIHLLISICLNISLIACPPSSVSCKWLLCVWFNIWAIPFQITPKNKIGWSLLFDWGPLYFDCSVCFTVVCDLLHENLRESKKELEYINKHNHMVNQIHIK